MLWRPRSIFHLVLLGFFTVIAPLCVAIFYTVQALDRLADENSQINQRMLALTRNSQALQSNLLDLERSMRQYITLEEPALLELYIREYKQLQQQLAELEMLLASDDEQLSISQSQTLAELESYLEQLEPGQNGEVDLVVLPVFDNINMLNLAFQRLSQNYVDVELEKLQLHADEIQGSLTLMVSLVAVLTFTTALVFIYRINRPIKQIEQEIEQLGTGDLSREIRISGPLEMRTLGQQLDWLRLRLSELELQKQQFLRHMSHELKTPLASLREGADLMAEGVAGELQNQQREIISIIRDNSLELQRLIENLLNYNQMLHSRQLIEEEVDLDALWLELLAAHRILIERRELKVQLDGSVTTWRADRAKLKTALENLLSNAVNYTPVGGEIVISWYRHEGALMLDVANSGNPISAQDRVRIFEPFYQGDASRQGPIKGSGIGLSVAQECVNAHGGKLELVAHERLPVCFRVYCPGQGREAA